MAQGFHGSATSDRPFAARRRGWNLPVIPIESDGFDAFATAWTNEPCSRPRWRTADIATILNVGAEVDLLASEGGSTTGTVRAIVARKCIRQTAPCWALAFRHRLADPALRSNIRILRVLSCGGKLRTLALVPFCQEADKTEKKFPADVR